MRLNPHAVLGVPPDASADEIKRAYRRLAHTWHPDRHANDPARQHEAQERFKLITAAYGELTRPAQRRPSAQPRPAPSSPPPGHGHGASDWRRPPGGPRGSAGRERAQASGRGGWPPTGGRGGAGRWPQDGTTGGGWPPWPHRHAGRGEAPPWGWQEVRRPQKRQTFAARLQMVALWFGLSWATRGQGVSLIFSFFANIGGALLIADIFASLADARRWMLAGALVFLAAKSGVPQVETLAWVSLAICAMRWMKGAVQRRL